MAHKIRFMETILRDGQQSQIATRMPIEDMVPILEALDSCGYESLEVWGGATFDSCLRSQARQGPPPLRPAARSRRTAGPAASRPPHRASAAGCGCPPCSPAAVPRPVPEPCPHCHALTPRSSRRRQCGRLCAHPAPGCVPAPLPPRAALPPPRHGGSIAHAVHTHKQVAFVPAVVLEQPDAHIFSAMGTPSWRQRWQSSWTRSRCAPCTAPPDARRRASPSSPQRRAGSAGRRRSPAA